MGRTSVRGLRAHLSHRGALAASSADEATALGRGVDGFREDSWAGLRLSIAISGNLAKFTQHPEALDWLVGTGDAVLVEVGGRDVWWAAAVDGADPRLADPATWPGENLSGFSLMRVRKSLQ